MIITDYITVKGTSAKNAYLNAIEICSAWNQEYNKHSPLLETKRYQIIDTLKNTSSQEVLQNIDFEIFSVKKVTPKVAAAYILENNTYFFVTVDSSHR